MNEMSSSVAVVCWSDTYLCRRVFLSARSVLDKESDTSLPSHFKLPLRIKWQLENLTWKDHVVMCFSKILWHEIDSQFKYHFLRPRKKFTRSEGCFTSIVRFIETFLGLLKPVLTNPRKKLCQVIFSNC